MNVLAFAFHATVLEGWCKHACNSLHPTNAGLNLSLKVRLKRYAGLVECLDRVHRCSTVSYWETD